MSNTETNRIENKEQLNEDFEQEVIAFLNHKEGGIIYVGIRKNGQVVGLKDVDLIENIGSGVLRILDAYDKSCFKFMEHFLRVTFKYRENPFKYNSKNNVSADDTLNDTINGTLKLNKNEQQILDLIINNNKITREEIATKTKLSDRTISRAIRHLQDEKVILREGSKKTGHWKILK